MFSSIRDFFTSGKGGDQDKGKKEAKVEEKKKKEEKKEKAVNDGGGLFSFGAKVAYKNQEEKKIASEYDKLFKILIIGNSKCGKSCFLVRFSDDSFFQESFISTIGVDFKVRTIEIAGRVVKLQLWDTAGQERFRTITSSYYRGAHGIIVAYDITDRESFEGVKRWLGEIERYACESVCKIIAGLKCDLQSERCVSYEEGKALADSLGLPFVECSAKDDINVTECVLMLCERIYAQMGIQVSAQKAVLDVDVRKVRQAKALQKVKEEEAEKFTEEDLFTSLNSQVKDCKGPAKLVAKKTDVNVFRLSLENLASDASLVTGDPIFCRRCGVMYSHLSHTEKLTRGEAARRTAAAPLAPDFTPAPPIHPRFEEFSAVPVAKSREVQLMSEAQAAEERVYWCCDFCGFANELPGEPDPAEVPRAAAVDYLVQPAPAIGSAANATNIVFVIDVSGSMCVTYEIAGNFKIKGSEKRDSINQRLGQAHAEGSSQWMPGQRRGVTHVSRLQCVQAAVEAQIEKIARESPDTRVGLITFNNEVTIYGDGTQEPLVVAGDKLDSWDELGRIGKAVNLSKPVHAAKEALLKRLWDLEENGATALGPAMLLGVAVAGTLPGSSVIVCTDGLANQGLGSLEGKEGKQRAEVAFYTECAEQAVLRGVTVSVISLIGAECALESLSVCAEKTSGTVERVDPRALTGELSAVTGAPKTVAWGAMAMVLLHRALRFRGEMDDEEEQRRSFWVVKDLGNVTTASECSFAYSFRPKEEIGDLKDLKEIPFQVQLLYTKADGSVRLRVATASVPVTEDRAVAEEEANVEIIGAHAAAHAARLAKEGNYEEAQLEARAAQRFIQRRGDREKEQQFNMHLESMDEVIREQRKKESAVPEGVKEKDRRQARNDETAAVISKAMKTNVKSLWK